MELKTEYPKVIQYLKESLMIKFVCPRSNVSQSDNMGNVFNLFNDFEDQGHIVYI